MAMLAATRVKTTPRSKAPRRPLGSEGPWWLELSRYLPFPLMLSPAVLGLVLSPWLGWRWVVASAVAVLLFVTVAMGLVWHSPEPARGDLRVMTYNTKAAQ